MPTPLEKQPKAKIYFWIGKFFIAIVVFLNLQAAMLFLLRPNDYAPGFELSSAAGNAMIQGMGLLFVMWNVPYVVALVNPVKHRLSLIEALVMQTIGVVGETTLWCLLPSGHTILAGSVTRFMLFDAADLLFLIFAWLFTRRLAQSQ